MSLCIYKDIFGKPGEGLHKYRLFNIAIIDVIFTIVASYFLHKKLNKSYPKLKLFHVLILLFTCGIIAHKLFCVRTTIDKLLFN